MVAQFGGGLMTAFLHPADACPECLTRERTTFAHPTTVEEAGPASIAAHYRCPRCLHSWWTGWNTEALANYPCPECGEEYQPDELRRPA